MKTYDSLIQFFFPKQLSEAHILKRPFTYYIMLEGFDGESEILKNIWGGGEGRSPNIMKYFFLP